MKLCMKLWSDENGFVVSSELILVATLLVIGMVTGLSTVRDQVVQELGDVADAISEINNSYSFSGVSAHAGSTAGTAFQDENDFCEVDAGSDQVAGLPPQCLAIIDGAGEQ
jgi:Flp pilus assembly pilin Flp